MSGLPVHNIPFLRPQPALLSRLAHELEAIERSGIYSNYGPVNTRLETALTEQVFGSVGGCVTVNNATTGLMLAIREAATRVEGTRYALMPSFTFAATGHAALWAGLTPLLCDINSDSWNSSPDAEDYLLRRHAGHVACVVPYACFGNGIDLERYERIAHDEGVGVVVDAAASLGSLDETGREFGAGYPHALVYSMHVTKTFATSEAGVIHCGDPDRLACLRAMGNFGFGRPREATLPGLNSKLSEVGALLALAKLEGFGELVSHRSKLAAAYREQLPGFAFQRAVGRRLAYQFMPVLLPEDCPVSRTGVIAALKKEGIGAGHYFSPHLAEQPFFAENCVIGDLPVTNQIAARALSLPMSDTMTRIEVSVICEVLRHSDWPRAMNHDFLRPAELAALHFKAVGRDVWVSRHAIFFGAEEIILGDHARVDAFCILSAGPAGIRVGRNVHFSAYSAILGREAVDIGDFATVSARCTIFSSNDDYSGATMVNATVPGRDPGIDRRASGSADACTDRCRLHRVARGHDRRECVRRSGELG